MQICKIGVAQLREALALVWEVFEEYEVPDYEEMGIQTFRHFIEYDNIVKKVRQGEMKFWGCYLNGLLVGVIALRGEQHISLLFVRGQFHRLGIARRLVRVAVAEVEEKEPEIRAVTVNSSPYAVEFYERTGFVALGPEKKADGIRFTSMRLRF
ncbi:MAG: GNAT family N-acetyltransferase [Lachnospiraceae bacterium]|nr:GNAT family N-acetyltransferase [Lachnospiraceae bacterium]